MVALKMHLVRNFDGANRLDDIIMHIIFTINKLSAIHLYSYI